MSLEPIGKWWRTRSGRRRTLRSRGDHTERDDALYHCHCYAYMENPNLTATLWFYTRALKGPPWRFAFQSDAATKQLAPPQTPSLWGSYITQNQNRNSWNRKNLIGPINSDKQKLASCRVYLNANLYAKQAPINNFQFDGETRFLLYSFLSGGKILIIIIVGQMWPFWSRGTGETPKTKPPMKLIFTFFQL